mmetsp:Transcript_22718/g.53649  ORF Transcript_22718/g.53649 Transcript_22718/m.53649 type:complete len:311 (-) Transcript_22718:46-978(-)
MHLKAFCILSLGIILEVVAFSSNQNSKNPQASHQCGRYYVSQGLQPGQQQLARPSLRIHRKSHVSTSLKSRMPGRNDTGPKNRSTARNEFSRTLQFYGNGAPVRKRPLDLSISATQTERDALAKRFRLSEIASLSADLTVQPAIGISSSADGGNHIEAIGKVAARVTQNCVRTNDEFEVDLEFNFDIVLKAMSAPMDPGSNEGELSAGEQAALEAASSLGSGRRLNKKGNRRKGVRGGESSKDLDDMGMKQLQDILQDFEVTDDILEDEACFCTDGIVDVGEIVSQIFRSNLDPYPKKPGSDPVSYTFTF